MQLLDSFPLRLALTLMATALITVVGVTAAWPFRPKKARGRCDGVTLTVTPPPAGVPATALPPRPLVAAYPWGGTGLMELGLALAPTGAVEFTVHFPAEERLEVLTMTRHEARLLGQKLFDLTAAAAEIAEAARRN